MKLYSENKNYKLYQGNMLDMLEVIEPNSIDSVITDPPYELNFMGKGWDNSGIAFQPSTWQKCYEVLKPGGYLLAFGGSRTFHRIACAIEDAGFEIRDTIMWLYGSGFPKSMDVGKAVDKRNGIKPIGRREPTGGITGGKNTGAEEKGWHSINNWYEYPECENEWKGWGTALKPSFEPIIVARKPFKGSLVDNVIEYGVGGINIDECRVESNKEDIDKLNKEWDREWNTSYKSYTENVGGSAGFDYSKARVENKGLTGRFPANTILTYDENDFDEVCGGFPQNQKPAGNKKEVNYDDKDYNNSSYKINYTHNPKIAGDNGGSASRYFYCAKASKKDRDEGLEEFEEKPLTITESKGRTFNDRCAICGKKFVGSYETICHCENPITDKTKSAPRKNIHPTVKPTELMQYLVRLVSPNGATILDPFNGSGSTGKAVMYENKERNKNYKYIGIELTEEYLPIAKARIEYVCKDNNSIENLKENTEEVIEGQTNIFDFIGE